MSIATQVTGPRPGSELDPLPVVVIGAGPVGLAAAAHLRAHGLTPLVLEAGEQVGAAMRQWGHIHTFTPWEFIVDAAAEKLLAPTGWTRPPGAAPPTGAELVEHYLEPLADVFGPYVVTGARVVAVSRQGLDKSRSQGRDHRPFVVRVQGADGDVTEFVAGAVIDASGTWGQRNPLGASGLPAIGEAEADAAGFLVGPLPDVLGRDRGRFAGKRTLVVGMGHSAANTLLHLAQLAREVPGTEAVWAIRSTDARRLYGGGEDDELPDRGKLGTDLRSLVASGAIEHLTGFGITALDLAEDGETVTLVGRTADGEARIAGVHNVAAATGFRPDLAMLSEIRLDLDSGLESPKILAPLIDPQWHSCGTVSPHGHRELAHPDEPGFFIVGMKSYGRAPTFLITTGNEQVRSIAAHLAGDEKAANEVQLVLPETGVCSVTIPLDDDTAAGGGCCGTTTSAADVPAAAHRELPVGVAPQGVATGVGGGRAADLGPAPAKPSGSGCG
ncbi:MAG: FAD-dependent oxidoreductase [Actinomycetes bacterium]